VAVACSFYLLPQATGSLERIDIRTERANLIVIPGLQEIDSVPGHPINQAMFLGDPPGPSAGEQILQRLGLADASEGIAQNRLNQLKDAQCNGPVRLHPVTQVGSELRMEDRLALTSAQRGSAQFSSRGAAFRAGQGRL